MPPIKYDKYSFANDCSMPARNRRGPLCQLAGSHEYRAIIRGLAWYNGRVPSRAVMPSLLRINNNHLCAYPHDPCSALIASTFLSMRSNVIGGIMRKRSFVLFLVIALAAAIVLTSTPALAGRDLLGAIGPTTTTFSFANIAWDDKPSVVKNKITHVGFADHRWDAVGSESPQAFDGVSAAKNGNPLCLTCEKIKNRSLVMAPRLLL